MSTNLASAATERKQRLIALRNRKQATEEGTAESSSTLVFKQRNFDPETRQSRKRGREDNEVEDTVEATVQGLTEKIIAEDKAKRAEELDLLNIAPKRANWDLKRDMTLRMAKVERKTNESIATLFRQRLQAMKRSANPDEQVDFVASMNAAEKEMQAAGSASDSE